MRRFIMLMLGAAIGFAAYAQGAAYEEFRKGMYERYKTFRDGMFERYDEFLDGAWTKYEVIAGEKRNRVPKPRTAPHIPESTGPATAPHTITPPAPASPDNSIPEPLPPVSKKPASSAPDLPSAGGTPLPQPKNESAKPVEFDFYGMMFRIPESGLEIAPTITGTDDFGARWRALRKNARAHATSQALHDLASELKLNDYLTFELVRSYVAARHSKASSAARASLSHFFLVDFGYDVRLGITGEGDGVLLVPFRQEISEHPFLKLNGVKYYVFMDSKLRREDYGRTSISTCDVVPDGSLAGIDCALSDLNLPYSPHHYRVDDGTLHIEGEINANIFPVLKHYPLMQVGDYARSEVQPSVRRDIVEQLSAQLAGKPRTQAVDELLKFIQHGFEYATDGEFHGYEKPYFLEENLFYSKNDCEDRAIFYTYLLWNVLGVPNQLIGYPGHESASVVLDELPGGDGYNYGGRRYLISDPTYIGSSTGMCMPSFVSEQPTIDHTY